MDIIEMINVGLIMSSPLNPRKFVDQNSIIELSKSIETVGLLQPVTLREIADTGNYELILGSRRLAATRLLGLDTISAIVKELDDNEALEAMIIENLQRKDIEPMDEAIAFNELYMKGMGYVDIATKVGKSPEFVKLRIKLNMLIPEFKDMLVKNDLSLSAAYEICKVISDVQISIFDQHYAESTTFENKWNYITLPELKEKLSKQFLSLIGVDFDTIECRGCVYNTTGHHTLFAEYKENNCTNVSCFQTKKQEHIIATIKKCVENDIDVMVKESSVKMIEQLKTYGCDNPILYNSNNYDLSFYPESEEEAGPYESASEAFGYIRAYTIGMIKDGYKYVYYREAEEVYNPVTPLEKVPEIKSVAVKEAIKEEQNEVEKLEKKDKRNVELMNEKIISDTKKMFQDSDFKDKKSTLFPIEEGAFIASVLYLCSSPKIKEIKDRFNKKDDFITNVFNMSSEDINIVKRCYIKQLVTSATVDNDKDLQSILTSLSSKYYGVKHVEIIVKYDEAYVKQKERIDARIAIIKGETKPAVKRETQSKKTVEVKQEYQEPATDNSEYVKQGNINED